MVLSKDFPRYFEAKNGGEAIQVELLQADLKAASKVLIEYFFGEKYVFVFLLDGQHIRIHKVEERSELLELIKKMRTLLENVPATRSIDEQYRAFHQTAHRLYDLLLEPSLAALPAAAPSRQPGARHRSQQDAGRVHPRLI